MVRLLAAAAAAIGIAVPAQAHHGFGRFNPAESIEVEGTLTGLDFVNPHSYVYFDTIGDDGTTQPMRCEMRAATVLRRSGWSPDLFVPGARVRITGNPHRDDPASCYAETLELGDTHLERYEQLTDAASAYPDNRPLRLASGEPNLGGDWAQEQYLMAVPPDGRDLVRTIHMDRVEHPVALASSRAGHSIGRWDGDTLVVDTVGFAPGILAGNVAHSDRVHVVERFTLDSATMSLRRDYVAEDPEYFTDRYIGSDVVRPADAPFAVDECRELTYIDYSEAARN